MMPKFIAPIAARYGSIAIQFLIVAVATHVLSPSDAGHYFVIMGIVWATYFLSGAGLPDGAVRFAPAMVIQGRAGESASLLQRSFWYSLSMVPLGALICGCVVAIYAGNPQTAALAGIWWASFGTIFIAAQIVVANGKGELGTAFFYSAANLGQLVVSVPLVLIFRWTTLNEVLIATAIGTAISASVCLLVAWTQIRSSRASPQSVGEAWRQGATIATGRVVQACLVWSPVWITSLVLGSSDAAVVGLSSRLISAVAGVLAAIRFSIRPSLAADAARGDWVGIRNRASNVAFFTTLLTLASMVVAVTIGDEVIGSVFGSHYTDAGWITTLMLLGTLGESLGGPVDEVLKMSGRAAEVLQAQVVIFVAGFGAQYLGGKLFGVSGLVTAYSSLFILLYTYLIWRVYRLEKVLIGPWPRRR